MGASRVGLPLAGLLLVCCSPGFGQGAPVAPPQTQEGVRTGPSAPPDPVVFESFFRTVAQLNVLRNERSSSLTQPPIQDLIGLTDQEMRVVNGLASDCVSKIGPARSESVFQLLESGDDLETSRIVLEHVRQLKAALGGSRFQTLDDWVRSPWAQHCFVTPCAPSPARR